ncbi:hypothetical protein ACFXKD_24910 [Nocardiopsis aegyptia]|uniref:hypothetical protein n=1 Tax=Nocardiopsis aegyptia TaxID=220378 RepID=UPI00366D791D
MSFQTPAAPTAAPRPGPFRITRARFTLHAQHRPAVHALYGAGAAGLVGTALIVLAAAPGLTAPGTPAWTIAVVPSAGLVAVLVVGALLYLSARGLPDAGTNRPEVYAAAWLQARTGLLGPDPEINRAARRMSDHLVRAHSPGYVMAPLVPVAAVVSVPALSEIAGPGFTPLMLTQLTPLALLVAAMVALFLHARSRQARLKRFRADYDRHAAGPAPTE